MVTWCIILIIFWGWEAIVRFFNDTLELQSKQRWAQIIQNYSLSSFSKLALEQEQEIRPWMITWYTRVIISLLLFVLELDCCPFSHPPQPSPILS